MRPWSRELIEAGLDNIILAFDGTTPEVYERYRKGGDFYEVKSNIHLFLRVKEAMKSDIFTVLQMVRLPYNQHQVSDFHRMWSIPGVDEVRVKEDEIVHSRSPPLRSGFTMNAGAILVINCGKVQPQSTTRVIFSPAVNTWRSEPIGNVNQESVYDLWNSEKMQK